MDIMGLKIANDHTRNYHIILYYIYYTIQCQYIHIYDRIYDVLYKIARKY